MRKAKLLGLLVAAAAAIAVFTSFSQSQSTKKSMKVNVSLRPAPTLSFTITPNSLAWSGGRVELNWKADGAVTGEITGIGKVEPSGAKTISLGACSGCSKRYTFTAANEDDVKASLDRAVSYGSMPPPPRRDDCFLAGTKVLMEGGSYKNIEDVQAGEKVMSYDVEKGKFVGAAVVETTKNATEKHFRINGNLNLTPSHVLYVDGKWAAADSIKVGSYLTNANGELVKIESVEAVEGPVNVFNLVTEYPNDFYAENYLVHNEESLKGEKAKGFAPGTKITLADGREAAIESLKPGDKLFSYDAKNKRYAFAAVKEVGQQQVRKTVLVNKELRIALSQTLYSFKNLPASAKEAPKKK
ncbi:MAG: hypothetical protein HY922_03285 [Elusimicrobia bacterium]|nr:hypothetical protein [Elusimicrobiota bacterium]